MTLDRGRPPEGLSVLVVDENADARRILSLAFSSAGHRAVLAGNGVSAAQALERATPDAVVLDLALPEIDGLSVLRMIRARPESARVPILVVTAFASPEDEERARAAGCDRFLTKPVDPDEVVRVVCSLVGGTS